MRRVFDDSDAVVFLGCFPIGDFVERAETVRRDHRVAGREGCHGVVYDAALFGIGAVESGAELASEFCERGLSFREVSLLSFDQVQCLMVFWSEISTLALSCVAVEMNGWSDDVDVIS